MFVQGAAPVLPMQRLLYFLPPAHLMVNTPPIMPESLDPTSDLLLEKKIYLIS